jgi:hypothetical protein
MEPLHERQIGASRSFRNKHVQVFLDMSDFMLDLATKGGRKDEMEKLARVIHGTKRKL